MELSLVKDWFAVAGGVLGVGGALYAWLTRDGNKALGAVAEIKEAVAVIDRRVARLELEMEHLPSKDDVAELKLSLAKVEGAIAVFGEALGGVQRTVSRIDGYLRKEG